MIMILLLASVLAMPSSVAEAQENVPAAPATLSQINRLPWPHIGSPPPEGAPPAEVDQWRREAVPLREAVEGIKASWTEDELVSAGELRVRVRQYEDLLTTASGVPGYGNALIADCLRRLSLTLMVNFALAHPAESDVIREMLKSDRVDLLDCAAFHGMLSENLKLAAPLAG